MEKYSTSRHVPKVHVNGPVLFIERWPHAATCTVNITIISSQGAMEIFPITPLIASVIKLHRVTL